MPAHAADRASTDKDKNKAYRPTSLDFINGPNPVEPQSLPQQHFNPSGQLYPGNPSDRSSLYIHHDATAKGHGKRRLSAEINTLDLPKPPVRQQNKRFRIPPTLSGLYQPPPDAGLLPSIVDQPPDGYDSIARASDVAQNSKPSPDVQASTRTKKVTSSGPAAAAEPQTVANHKLKRIRWSEDETADLLKGVAKFGAGNWTKILKHEEYKFQDRSALDLKDRFRVCCPEEYLKTPKKPSRAKSHSSDNVDAVPSARFDRKTTTNLEEIGVQGPFKSTLRRKRHVYTDAEDTALYKGVKKHGNKAWLVIQQDADLNLGHRKPTDLRDRFRTKFPDDYKKLGLASRPDDFGKPDRRSRLETTEVENPAEAQIAAIHTRNDSEAPTDATKLKQPPQSNVSIASLRQRLPSAMQFPTYNNDVFFGASDEQADYGEDPGQITLDRGILDWPMGMHRSDHNLTDLNRTLAPDLNIRTSNDPAIQTGRISTVASNTTALPPLATITSQQADLTGNEQLELPSIVGLDTVELKIRNLGHYLGFE